MNHPHTNEFAVDHFQHLAFSRLVSAAIANLHGYESIDHAYEQKAWRRHPHVLDTPVGCVACGTLTRKILYAYDDNLRWHEVALCDRELKALRSALPTGKLGYLNATSLDVVPLSMIFEELEGDARRREAQRLAPIPEGEETGIHIVDDGGVLSLQGGEMGIAHSEGGDVGSESEEDEEEADADQTLDPILARQLQTAEARFKAWSRDRIDRALSAKPELRVHYLTLDAVSHTPMAKLTLYNLLNDAIEQTLSASARLW